MISSRDRKKPARPADHRVRPTETDRLPPFDDPAEDGVLGCILLEPGACMGKCMESFRGNALVFYDPRRQTVFNVMRELYDGNEGIDEITVRSRLTKRGVFGEVGGDLYLMSLRDKVPSAANLPTYLKVVREKYLMRQALTVAARMTARIFDAEADVDVEKLLVQCEADISQLTEAEGDASEQTMRQVMRAVQADMEQWHYSRGSAQLRGLPLGRPGAYIDKVSTGVRETDFVTLAGRPGDGKSAKALNVIEELAENHVWFEKTGKTMVREEQVVEELLERRGIAVGVFSIEMDAESLGYRLMFGRAGVSEAKFNQGFSETGDGEKLIKAAGELAKLNIILDDTPAQSIGQIAAKARRWVKQYGIKLFVLDYLQLAESDDPRDEARVRVNKISKKIMALKKQLNVPWLVLAQLNRNIETSERDRPPVLSDLAESGSIEQDSDKVIILKKTPRRDLEAAKTDGKPSDKEVLDQICSANNWGWDRRPRRVDLWVVKNRRGPTGKAEEVFQGNLCRFEDWHLFKLKHGVEERKEGESKHLAPPEAKPTQQDFDDAANGA